MSAYFEAMEAHADAHDTSGKSGSSLSESQKAKLRQMNKEKVGG